jgi:hypothetical protein
MTRGGLALTNFNLIEVKGTISIKISFFFISLIKCFFVFKTSIKECVRMIAYIFSVVSTRVNTFKECKTSILVHMILSLVDNSLHFFVFQIVRAKQLFEIFFSICIERTSMKFVLARFRLV